MRRRWLLGAFLTPLSLASPACGTDATAVDDETSSTGGADTSADGGSEDSGESEAGTGGETDATSDGTTGDDAGETTGDPIDDWARGIQITRVDANPGVAIPLAIDGQPTTAEQRYTRIPARRPTWLFVEVEVEAGWEAREIEAVFTIHRADNTSLSASQIRTISRSTDEWQSDPEGGGASISEIAQFAGFYIGLPAEEIVPDMGISVTLHEVDTSYLDEPEPASPSIPTVESGEQAIPFGVEDSNNFFRLVMVPIALNSGGCTATPDYSETNIQRYADHLFASIPVENIELVIHEPYPWNQPLTDTGDMSQVLNAMSQLKASEGEEPYTYYYALMNNCGGCISGGGAGCVAGLAQVAGSGMDSGDSLSRVGSGLLSTSTFVHEIGHTQGRIHVECEGAGAQGNDPSYPHDNGILGAWGLDQRELFLHHPDYGYDYMSYCGPSWASDWQWEATYNRIETLSSWASDTAPPTQASEQDLLVVMVHDDGTSSSFTTRGWIDEARADSEVRIAHLDAQGHSVAANTPVRVTQTAHSSAKQYVFAAPPAGSSALNIVDHGTSHRIELDTLSAN